MKGSRAAARYAKALIELATEKKAEDAVLKDMEFIASTIDGSRDLELMLYSPVVKANKKQTVLAKVFDAHIGDITKKFIATLTGNGREELLALIADEYIAKYKISKNITSAEIISASKLDKAIVQRLQKMIEEAEQKKVEITESVNPDLIGGVIVRIGDRQIDASIARKFNDLKQRFSSNPQ